MGSILFYCKFTLVMMLYINVTENYINLFLKVKAIQKCQHYQLCTLRENSNEQITLSYPITNETQQGTVSFIYSDRELVERYILEALQIVHFT